MIVEHIGKDLVNVILETELDVIFWDNTKKKQRESEETIKSLKRENRALREDLSYLQLRNKK